MSNNPPRRHHFIPEFYQRRWAGDDGRVERFQRVETGKIVDRRVFPSEAGWEKDLYRDPRPALDEWRAQALELAVFKPIDDNAALALDAMLSDRKALRDNLIRHDWAIFLRSMLLRTPYQKAGTLATLERIWREADASEKYAAMWQPGMPATATEYLELLNPNEAMESAFRLFAASLAADRTVRHIVSLPWRIFDSDAADFKLLLSDHPVVLVPLETANGQIAMPLSPTKFLVAVGNPGIRARVDALPPKQAVRSVNKLVVQRAQHCVIASDTRQREFIVKHFGVSRVAPFLASERPPKAMG